MNEVGVLDALLERPTTTLTTKRALACIDRFHAAHLRIFFAQSPLRVSDRDRNYGNSRFVTKMMAESAAKRLKHGWSKPIKLCVEGETVYAEVPLDLDEWHGFIRVKKAMKRTTIYFLCRALAFNADISFTSSSLCAKLTYMRSHPATQLHRIKNNKNADNECSNIYSVLSGVNECVALELLCYKGVSSSTLGRACNHRGECNLGHRVLDSDAVRVIGPTLLKQKNLTNLYIGNTSMPDCARETSPFQRYRSLYSYILGGTDHCFEALDLLDLSHNALKISGTTLLAKALKDQRFPALQTLMLEDIGMDSDCIDVLASVLVQHPFRKQLRCLWVGNNTILPIGLSTLLTALKSSRLESLGIECIGCNMCMYERVATIIQQGNLPSIQEVYIGDFKASGIGQRACTALDLALAHQSSARAWKAFEDKCLNDGPFPLGQGVFS